MHDWWRRRRRRRRDGDGGGLPDLGVDGLVRQQRRGQGQVVLDRGLDLGLVEGAEGLARRRLEVAQRRALHMAARHSFMVRNVRLVRSAGAASGCLAASMRGAVVTDVLERKPAANRAKNDCFAANLANPSPRHGQTSHHHAVAATSQKTPYDDAVPRALVRQREEELREVRVGPLRAEVRREEPVRRVALGVERVVVRLEGPRVLSRSAAALDDVHIGLDVGPEGREQRLLYQLFTIITAKRPYSICLLKKRLSS